MYSAEKCLIGSFDRKLTQSWGFAQTLETLPRVYYGKVKLMPLLAYLPIVKVNRHKTFAIISINTAIALSITNTIKLKKFVLLVLDLLNLPLNKLTVALRFPVHNGS
jgi:hypothetical protein